MIELTFLKKSILIKQELKCAVCPYWYFLNYSFMFQPNVCNRCHDLLLMSLSLSDTAILKVKGSDYHCIISLISKNEAINFIQNADSAEKIGTLKVYYHI